MPKAGKTKVAAKSIKLIHPQSRKANKMGAREIHKERVRKVHQDTSLKNSLLIDKLTWFQEALEPDKANYSRADAEELVEGYLERFEEELEQISIVNSMKARSGRQHATREDVINQAKKREEEQFNTCGFEIPDICDGRNLKVFRVWDGTAKFMSNIKMRKVVRTIPDLSEFAEQSTSSPGSAEINQEVPDERVDEQRVDDQDDDDVNDEGVEDDLLGSDDEEMEDERNDSKEDEGVESH